MPNYFKINTRNIKLIFALGISGILSSVVITLLVVNPAAWKFGSCGAVLGIFSSVKFICYRNLTKN